MSMKGQLAKLGMFADGVGNFQIAGSVIATGGIIGGIGAGSVYFLDGVNGSDDYSGKEPDKAYLTLTYAYTKLTAGQNDVLYVIGGATSVKVTAALDWAKDYTHMIGLCAPIPMSQRARIVNSGSLASIITVSATGCMFSNLQIGQYGSAAGNINCLIVTGNRNYFYNVHIAGMGHATPGAQATANSLKLDGCTECFFERCTIGLDTIKRTTNCQILLDSTASKIEFKDCKIISQCETTGSFMVKFNDSTAFGSYLLFDNCLFFNKWVNNVNGLDECFDMVGGVTHYVILKNGCTLVGIDEWSAGDEARLLALSPTGTAAAMGLAVTPVKT